MSSQVAGEPNYSRYDAAQLRQVLGRIDRERFPERVAAIEARLGELAQTATERAAATAAQRAPQADRSTYAPLLRGPAWGWLAVGAWETAHLLWQLRAGGGAASFNFVPLLVGFLLLTGGLRMVIVLRWLCWSMLPVTALAFVMEFVQPVGLTLAQVRLAPLATLGAWLLTAASCVLVAWTARRLGAAPIEQARAAEGRKRYDMRWPLALGVIGAVVCAAFAMNMLRGESAEHGKLLAMMKVPGNHKFHVVGLNMQQNSTGTYYRANVMFWNDTELGSIAVDWKE